MNDLMPSIDSPGGPSRVRLVVVQGPVQALAACAAVRHAERLWGAGHTNVMLFGGILADDESAHYEIVRQAAVDCVGAIDWAAILEFIEVSDVQSLRSAVGKHGDVAEIVCGRNWQPVNETALSAFPDARRIVVGDGLGVIDTGLVPGQPGFDVAMPVIPQPLNRDSLDETDLEVVPRDTLLEMIAVTRERSPRIRELDAALAEFAAGGILLLVNYLTESYLSTLKAEIDLALDGVREVARGGDPIVIKPHPRSSLGQAAALARRLRAEGHAVRIMGQFEFGHYPIEVFEGLVRAVHSIQFQGSSSAISLSYLYGVRPAAALSDRRVQHALLPRERKRAAQGMREVMLTVKSLEHWDGRSPVPIVAPPLRVRFVERVMSRLTRPITWNPVGSWRRRGHPWRVPALPSAVLRHLADPNPIVVADRGAGVAWLLDRAEPDVIDAMTVLAQDTSSTPAVLGRLDVLSRGSGAAAGAIVAVTQSTHAPGWMGWWRNLAGVHVVEGAQLSAEKFEDLLEVKADTILRLPEIGGSVRQHLRRGLSNQQRRLPPGFVAFVFRVRPSTAAEIDSSVRLVADASMATQSGE
jgi:hypothetical protein